MLIEKTRIEWTTKGRGSTSFYNMGSKLGHSLNLFTENFSLLITLRHLSHNILFKPDLFITQQKVTSEKKNNRNEKKYV